MTFVANFFNRIAQAIPSLLLKAGTVLVLIFTVGMFAGYWVAITGITPLIFLIPVVAMIVMWYRLDEGVLLLVLLTVLVFFFPGVVESAVQTVLGFF